MIGGEAERCDLAVERFDHGVELRLHEGCMLLHVRKHAGLILQELHMAQLVDLIKADAFRVEQLLHVSHVGFAAGEAGDACAREGDLRGGGKFKHHVRIACVAALGQHFLKGNELAAEFVYAVGVVPHDDEIACRRFERSKAGDGRIAVNDAFWVGILRHAPNALHGGVFHIFFHNVHVRAGFRHRHVEHFDAEGLADGEMPVIPGDGAEELHFVELAPGRFRVQKPVGERL